MKLLTHSLETPVNTSSLEGYNDGFFVDKFITRQSKLEQLFRTFVVGLVCFQQPIFKNLHNSHLSRVYKGFGLPKPFVFSINNQLTLKKLRVFKVLSASDRITSLDFFRALAILSTVIFHFNNFPFGELGVDLFFVLSGILVGGILIKQFKADNKISFTKFFLQRGFKIWPSYYFFILSGSVIAYFFYHNTNPELLIFPNDMYRYLFFYQNYTGLPFHWIFDHVWSLCVEEHFYIILPIVFLIVQSFVPKEKKLKYLFAFIILLIASGILFKPLSYLLLNSQDTSAGTHNRIDALAWGILLRLIVTYTKTKINMLPMLLCGLGIFACNLHLALHSEFYSKLFLHSVTPFAFFLIILSLYETNFSKFKVLGFISYYSYNWYLWHPIFVIFLTKHFTNTFSGTSVYLLTTFAVAMLATILIEEPFLKLRSKLIK